MLTNGAFTALILICGHFCHAVPPPSNVMVKCKDLQITVSWDYSEPHPQTIFRVNVTGSIAEGSFEANTTEHQYDLSPFVFGSKERYLSFLVVLVTAVQGGERSEAVPSKSFSFDQLKSVDIKCSLDFPPVKVHKAEEGAFVKFRNPCSFYDVLKKTVAPNSDAVFSYSVSSSANTFKGSCSASDPTCKLDVTLSAEECVTLKGDLLFEKLHVRQIAFKETKKYCTEKQGAEIDGLVMFAILLGSIFLVIIVVAVAVICKMEAWTMKIPMPKIRVNSHVGEQQSFFIPAENSRVSIVSPPVETTSLVSEDENFCEEPEPNGGNYLDGGRLEDSVPNQEGFVSGEKGTDEDSPDGSVKTECVSLSSTEEESSPYDRPHGPLHRDLGDGEPVIGYTGK